MKKLPLLFILLGLWKEKPAFAQFGGHHHKIGHVAPSTNLRHKGTDNVHFRKKKK